MSNIVVYDPAGIVSNMVTEYALSVNTPDYDSVTDKLVNPDVSGVSGVDQKYWKVYSENVVEMDASEKEQVDCPDLDAYKVSAVEQVTEKNNQLFDEGALYDGKRFAITKPDHAGWLALVMAKDSLEYPYNVYTINPPAFYPVPNADALTGLVFGVLFPRCTQIYDDGQDIVDAMNSAETKEEVDTQIAIIAWL